MKIYVLISERELTVGSSPRIRSREYFSTKQKALDYLETVILNGYGFDNCNIKVTDWSVTIKWLSDTITDTYFLDSIELDPCEYPVDNDTDYYLTFWD